jgi:hypothetical protein
LRDQGQKAVEVYESAYAPHTFAFGKRGVLCDWERSGNSRDK